MNIDFQGSGDTTATTSSGAVLQPSGAIWNVNGNGYGAEVPLVTSHGVALPTTLWTAGFTGSVTAGDALYSDYLAGSVELRGLDPKDSYELDLPEVANPEPTVLLLHGIAGLLGLTRQKRR